MKKLNNTWATFYPAKCFLVGFFCLLFVKVSLGQNHAELLGRRTELRKEINTIQGLFDQTKKNRQAELLRLNAMQKQVGTRTELLENIHQEITLLEQKIERSEDVIASLDEDLEVLKEDFAKMARYAYRNKATNNWMMYLFSAENFQDAIRRWRLISNYEAYRSKQAKMIQDTQASLDNIKLKSQEELLEKEVLLATEKDERLKLEREVKKINTMLANLKNEEANLSADLHAKKVSRNELNDKISAIISTNMKQSVVSSRNHATEVQKHKPLEQFMLEIEANFLDDRGALQWPVKQGYIVRNFGEATHPDLKKIMVTNNGIDIQTPKRAKALAIHDGVVKKVFSMPEYGKVIIVQHGIFYSTYSNLSSNLVTEGDRIRTGDVIGEIKVDQTTNTSELHFELWRSKQRLNPAKWLAKHP